MSAVEVRAGSMPLENRIHATEERLLERRQRIGTVATGLRRDVRARMVSPGVLAASFGLGVLLERTNRRRTWSLTRLLMAARLGRSLVTSVSSWRRAGGQAATPDEPSL